MRYLIILKSIKFILIARAYNYFGWCSQPASSSCYFYVSFGLFWLGYCTSPFLYADFIIILWFYCGISLSSPWFLCLSATILSSISSSIGWYFIWILDFSYIYPLSLLQQLNLLMKIFSFYLLSFSFNFLIAIVVLFSSYFWNDFFRGRLEACMLLFYLRRRLLNFIYTAFTNT